MPEEAPDFEQLEEYLRALAFTTRLELVYKLRMPQALQDLRLPPRQVRAGENPDRAISRQAIEAHLEQLVAIGVVSAREAEKGQRGKVFFVNPRKLYQITEEFRKLSTFTLSAPGTPDATVDLQAQGPAELEPGPKLIVVHGLVEGQAFPLRRSELRDGRGWVVGRKAGLHVALGYDPYVSVENCEVVPTPQGFALLDLRSSRNGTSLNWRRLGPDERAPLRTGDVVGVGRSLLLFRAE